MANVRSRILALGVVIACALGCNEKPAGSLKSLAPPPLAPLAGGATGDAGVADAGERELAFQLDPAPVHGEEPPAKALRMVIGERHVRIDETDFPLESREVMKSLEPRLREATVILSAKDGDVFLAEAAPVLEALDDAGAKVWIQHPTDARVAFPIRLRDEAAFQTWIDEPRLGKVRAIQRADGFELMTKIGKLPGPDPNGPTIPVRGGQMDLATLRRGLARLKQRFDRADDACLVPSFGTELQSIARALTGFWSAPGDPVFSDVCLVYPRPSAARRDAGH